MQKNSVILFCFLIILFASCMNPNKNLQNEKPILFIEKDTIDFKFKNKNETTLIPIEVMNKGNTDLRIINIKGSCGCTDIKFDTAAIKPGGNSTILLNYKSSGDTTPVLKNIVIETNANPSLKVIYLKGVYKK